jgi:hypothetical protein
MMEETTMGKLNVGDYILDEKGNSVRVTFATSVMHNHKCYKVIFSDGEEIVCDAEYLWTVYDKACRNIPVVIKIRHFIFFKNLELLCRKI